MKLLIIIAIAVILLIPVNAFAQGSLDKFGSDFLTSPDYYISSLISQITGIVLIPIGVGFWFAKKRFGKKKHD